MTRRIKSDNPHGGQGSSSYKLICINNPSHEYYPIPGVDGCPKCHPLQSDLRAKGLLHSSLTEEDETTKNRKALLTNKWKEMKTRKNQT